MDPTPTTTPAQDLERELRSIGYVPGFPPRLTPRNRLVDGRGCRRRICGSCGTRGLLARPFHKRDAYRLVCVCPKCGAAEEA